MLLDWMLAKHLQNISKKFKDASNGTYLFLMDEICILKYEPDFS